MPLNKIQYKHRNFIFGLINFQARFRNFKKWAHEYPHLVYCLFGLEVFEKKIENVQCSDTIAKSTLNYYLVGHSNSVNKGFINAIK
jgi:hypothetical protein